MLSDAPENDSVAARGAELRPFEGSRVPQHDFIFFINFIKFISCCGTSEPSNGHNSALRAATESFSGASESKVRAHEA